MDDEDDFALSFAQPPPTQEPSDWSGMALYATGALVVVLVLLVLYRAIWGDRGFTSHDVDLAVSWATNARTITDSLKSQTSPTMILSSAKHAETLLECALELVPRREIEKEAHKPKGWIAQTRRVASAYSESAAKAAK